VLESQNAGTTTTAGDVTYCYNSATPAPTCATTPGTDRAKLQWQLDNLTGQATAYTYDTAGHVTTVTETGGTGPTTWAYTYDARGNRLTATATGGTSSSQTLTFDAGNKLTTTGYSYDGTGNLTADPAGTYGYNGAEQMTTVTQGGTAYNYKYAGTSQVEVIQQQVGSTTYKLVYGRSNPQGQPVIEQALVGSSTAYVDNDPVTGQPLLLHTSDGAVAMYVYTGTGNPVALVRIGSATFHYDYDPYGVPTLLAQSGTLGTAQNPFLFKGGLQDRQTGWVHFGNRWYNTTLGRWTQQDTLDTPLDPTNANRYAYAADDPINNIDPTGRTVGLGCVAGTIGGAALVGLGVGELAGDLIGTAVSAAPSFGASVVAGGALATGIAGEIAFGVYLGGSSLGECLS
jgi:RHS repeat-associated protein